MTALVDALRARHLLTQLPLPASGELAALSAGAVSSTGPFDVGLTICGFSGSVHGATVTGGPTSARLTLPLTGLVLSARVEGAPAALRVDGAAVAVVDIDQKGVRWAVSGQAGLTPDPEVLHAAPGGAAVSLRIRTAALRIVDGAPALDLAGTVTVSGLPSTRPLDLDFILVCGRQGFTGSVSDTAGPVDYGLGWSGTGGPFPDSIDVSTPFTPPLTAGPDVGQRVAGHSVVRARLVHGVDGYHGTVAVESGADGILSGTDAGVAAAAVLATASVGATTRSTADPEAVELAALVATAKGFTSALDSQGRTRVTGVRFDPLTPGRARIDYQAELSCRIRSAVLDARTVSPMRVVVRDAVLDYASGLPRLNFKGASIDVSDTGQWEVTQPSGLLQVVGVRSGHGSSFFELDLRLTFELGPIHATGAVLRVALDGDHEVSLQGFDLSVEVPELVSGEGRLSFDSDNGFAAALRVELTRLNLTATAGLTVEPLDGSRSILAVLGVSLPAPVPLANSGLGLFGIEAILGLNRIPVNVGTSIPERLTWRPDKAHTVKQLGPNLFGAGVAVGTLPDLGFAFSALGRVVVRSPDFGLLVALDATVLSRPRSVTDPTGGTSTAGMIGLLSVTPDELYAGVTGTYHLPPDDPRHPDSDRWHLLQIDVPAEARYPRTTGDRSAWQVHLGAAPGYGAPIRATLLPELFAVGAEAFLMLHGNGFSPPLPGLTASPAAGFAAAAGFSFQAKYGMPPVWAELAADSVVAFGSRPVFVAGTVGVRGSLHLGPFSLGLNSTLKLQLGPGDGKFAELKACGSIDLWLIEISGCVHLTFGHSEEFTPDLPQDPLTSATVADCNGVAVAQGGALLDRADRAPAMWPDGVVLLGFAPGPTYDGARPLGVDDAFHKALDPKSTPPGPGSGATPDGTVGSPGYPGHWTLTGLSLRRWADGAGTRLTEPRPACWQRPPGVPANVPTTGRVLALFTHDPALWSRSLIDGGEGDPADPAARHVRDCSGDWPMDRGWAVGGNAILDGDRWRLPPMVEDMSVQGPVPTTTATLEASVRTVLPGELSAVPASTPFLPPDTALVPAGPPSTEPVAVPYLAASAHPDGVEFPGLLPLADLAVVPPSDQQEGEVAERLEAVETRLGLGRALAPTRRTGVTPVLVLWSRSGFEGVEVFTRANGQHRTWDRVDEPKAGDGFLGVYEWSEPDPVRNVVIRHAPFPADGHTEPALAVVAVGGVTTVAADAADRARDTGRASVEERKKPRGQALSGLFEPDRTYRLDFTWEGKLDGDSRVSGGTDTRYFRIAPHAAAPPPPEALYRDVTSFHPKMLGRYLKGYSVRGDTPVFYGDPLVVTFSTDTVQMVADVYGYRLVIAVDRTDLPPPGPTADVPKFLAVALKASRHPEFLDVVDRRGLEAVHRRGTAPALAACSWPVAAVDAVVTPDLVADACYDLTPVLVVKDDSTVPHRVRTRLPHVSFRTSRWRTATDLFKNLGFGSGAAGVRHLAVRSAVTDPGEDSDGALRAALDRAGANPGPLDVAARTTVLWVPRSTGGHALGAILLEAVEPLVRADRLDRLAIGGFTTRTDRAATSVLFVPRAPVPAGPITLTRRERDPVTATWSRVTATLTLPAPDTVPALALEVWP
ncbi:hypothetical protein ACWEQL_28845 [Kitasatospora sp. NPDC004240]